MYNNYNAGDGNGARQCHGERTLPTAAGENTARYGAQLIDPQYVCARRLRSLSVCVLIPF